MENLKHLMSAYFHQDWWDEYDGSWRAAVDDFARRAPDRVAGTVTEISSILDAGTPDEEVARLLDSLGSYRDPGGDSGAHIEWLRDIRQTLVEGHHPARRPA